MKKISFVSHSQINKSQWDYCMNKSINRSVYGISWYLDIVSENWDALIYGDYELIIPVPSKKYICFFPFIRHLFQPLFCQQLGAFSSNENLLTDSKLVMNILSFFKKKYYNLGYSFNHHTSSVYKNCIINNQLTFKYIDRINLELDLQLDYDQLFKDYHKNTKRNINKNFSHKIKSIKNVSFFVNFLKKNLPKNASLKTKNYKTIYNIINISISKCCGKCLGLYNDKDELLAGVFFLTLYGRHILLFNASLKDNSQYNYMTFLINFFIKQHACKNEFLDFEGSNIKGVKRFYKSFGAVEKNYLHIK